MMILEPMFANYHTHTLFSDGHADPGAYIAQAETKQLTAVGFSDHAPLPFANNFTMAFDRLSAYSDAHQPEHLDGAFDDVVEMLGEVGYTEIHQLNGHSWDRVSIPVTTV